MSWLAWLVTVAVTLLVGLRFAALETPIVVQVLAFYPYLMIVAVLLAVIPWLVKRRGAAIVVTTVVLLGLAPLLARVVGTQTYDDADGSDLITVATVNTLYGRADAEEIVAIADEVEVLALQEITTDALRRLSRAGLDTVLPYHEIDLRPGAGGSGIWSRYPLQSEPVPASIFSSPQVLVQRPGRYAIRVRGVHVVPPVASGFSAWRPQRSR
ncbi:hypothetical protein BH24ACT15_BH24ACT15_09550 [soil metagenome]